MVKNHRQNLLYEYFEDICVIFQKYDVSFSLGDGLRPGSLADASDAAQFAELKTLGELTKIAWKYDVQVMIEGPGHIPLDQIEMQGRKRERNVLHEGAFLYSRPAGDGFRAGLRSHHVRHWRGDDRLARCVDAVLRDAQASIWGLPKSRRRSQARVCHRLQDCGACSADIARGRPGARDRDDELSRARFAFDWKKQFELSIDPETARAYHDETLPEEGFKDAAFCSMCGPKFCSMNHSVKTQEFTAADAEAVPGQQIATAPN